MFFRLESKSEFANTFLVFCFVDSVFQLVFGISTIPARHRFLNYSCAWYVVCCWFFVVIVVIVGVVVFVGLLLLVLCCCCYYC